MINKGSNFGENTNFCNFRRLFDGETRLKQRAFLDTKKLANDVLKEKVWLGFPQKLSTNFQCSQSLVALRQ